MTYTNNRAPVSNQAVNQYIYGGAYFGPLPTPVHRNDEAINYNLGLRLGNAPQIVEEDFVGRSDELEQLQTWLAPRSQRQNVVALYGLGGMGKTQLSVHFARKFAHTYSSVFWLQAQDESTLRTGLATLAAEVMEADVSSNVNDLQEEQRLARLARQWLSRPDNDRWLVVYDNYDEPRLPGIPSSTGYDIRNFFPHRGHGSILITTRSPRLTFAKQLRLKKLEDIDQSLAILTTRSGRTVETDPDATRLAKRLDGLPLALATAGTYLRQSADSFGDYLKLYDDCWRNLDRYSEELLDYEDRTLYSTWNISYTQIQAQDATAAELLRLMAYFNNQDLWYELFHAGAENQPPWRSEAMENKGRFNRAMSKLHDYSLVEVGAGRYSLHTCVHDWTMEYLNRNFDENLWRFAVHCVAQSVKWYTEREYWVENRRLLPHVQRLEANRDRRQNGWEEVEPGDMIKTAELFRQLDINVEAEEMYVRALQGYEKACGPEHTSTLNTVNNLGNLYAEQGKMVEAEQMYVRALQGYEKTGGPEHTSTLDTVNNLGVLYANQGKMVEAEQMYVRPLQGYEKVWGPEHTSTLDTVNNLGTLYKSQGKIMEAEQMYGRALRGYENALGPAHPNTRLIAANLRVLRTITNSGHGRIN